VLLQQGKRALRPPCARDLAADAVPSRRCP